MMAKQRQRRKKSGSSEAMTVKQAAFLAAYVECGSIPLAARLAGCNRSTHCDWMKRDEAYQAKFAEAHAEVCEIVEAEIHRRAVLGIDEPVIYKGKLSKTTKPGSREHVPLTVKKYSDVLLIFLAKALMPEKYRERMDLNHSGQVDNTLHIVREEGWYGNDAHDRARDQAAQGVAASTSNLALAGPVQDADMRPALGQDGTEPPGVY